MGIGMSVSNVQQLDRRVTRQLLWGKWADTSPIFNRETGQPVPGEAHVEGAGDGIGWFPTQPSMLAGAADWRAREMVENEGWSRNFSPSHLEEISQSLATLRASGILGTSFGREQFPLPQFGAELEDAARNLEDGRGIVRFRGFPVDRFSYQELQQIIWGFGLYLGTARPQDQAGTLVADVRDLNGTRGYENNGNLGFHADPCDVTALFCINVPIRGGLSYIVSSLAIHNEIARTRPDLLKVLYEPIYWNWAGRQNPGQKSWCEVPLFARDGEKFVSIYSSLRIARAISSDDVPDYSDRQKEAVNLIAALLARPEFRLACKFLPGDLQLLNNYVTYHGRTSFEDDPAAGRIRHLLKLWLSVPNSRNLPIPYKAIFKEIQAGALRGGYVTPEEES
jgi:hypothetical protein